MSKKKRDNNDIIDLVDDDDNDDDNDNDSTVSSSTLITATANKLPHYVSKAFEELYGEDGLLIFGRGMGSMSLLACLIRFYADTSENGHAAIVREEEAQQQAQKQQQATTAKAATAGTASATAAASTTTTHNNASNNKDTHSIIKPPLVIVLGLNTGPDAGSKGERGSLTSILENWGCPSTMMPQFLYNENSQGATKDDRIQHYKRGGVLCISSRILIVDLLTPGVLNPNQIDGFLVYHAEKVNEQSTEAFILRIYANACGSRGFVKAISEHPDRCLHGGFAAVDKIMKSCHVRKLYLYPRFHYLVRDELEGQNPPSVTELHQSLSPRQKLIQQNILVAMKQCLDELKKKSPLIERNDKQNELTMNNCLYLHSILAKQLKQDWHRISPDIKQYIEDLKTLQSCLERLITFDCVGFYRCLQSIKATSGLNRFTKAMWIIEPAGVEIYKIAKERLYQIVHPPKPKHSAAAAAPKQQPKRLVSKLIANLEPDPKWNLLKMVLKEIQDEHNKKEKESSSSTFGPVNVLVMVKDGNTMKTIQTILCDGGRPGSAAAARTYMNERWRKYLYDINDSKRVISHPNSGSGGDASSKKLIPEEDRLLLEEESRLNLLWKQGDAAAAAAAAGGDKKRSCSSSKTLNEVPGYIKKRRRIASEKSRGRTNKQADDLEREAVLDDAIEAAEHELEEFAQQQSLYADEDNNGGDMEDSKPNSMPGEQDGEDEVDPIFRVTYPDDQLRIVLQSYSNIEGDEASLLLQDIRPQYIVLYDTSDMAFIRSVEIYSSLLDPTASTKVRVYALMFEASAEEKLFRKSLEREKNAFERLIEHKKNMPAQMLTLGHGQTQEMQQAMADGVHVEGSYMDGTLPLAFDSRRGRGKLDKSKIRRDIAVDVREFRSAVPSTLHQGGMRLAPVTLTVGDFVLSNAHCVERKGVHTGDLHGSFKSGRLYTQVEAMCKHYKCPCLLIEFDPDKPFSLQKVREIGTSIRSDAISSKLSVLAMHFPRLRIIWSRGPIETLKIFQDLKRNHDEPDVDRAVEVGRNESVEALLGGGGGQQQQKDGAVVEDEINEDARDMLLRLPGVNVHSARKIMQECDSLAELSELSRDELRRIAGPITGQKLFTFFRQKVDS